MRRPVLRHRIKCDVHRLRARPASNRLAVQKVAIGACLQVRVREAALIGEAVMALRVGGARSRDGQYETATIAHFDSGPRYRSSSRRTADDSFPGDIRLWPGSLIASN